MTADMRPTLIADEAKVVCHAVSPTLPLSGELAWWLTAWLRGQEPADNVLDTFAERAHQLQGCGARGSQLLDLMTFVRHSGSTSPGLALPCASDPAGLGGPRELNEAAMSAGEALIVGRFAFVPHEHDEVVHWQVHDANPRQLADVGEADRSLRSALLAAAVDLAALDVARWRPEVADELMNLHQPPYLDAPRGSPVRCAELAARGLQACEIVDLALADDGGAVTSYDIDARRSALTPLRRAGRHAIVAACSSEVWPD